MSLVGTLLRQRVLNLRALKPLERLYIIMRLPSIARLSYRLFLDRRVSFKAKATTLGVIGLVLSPLDLPGWVPVIGQASDAFVIVNVLDLFIKAAPRHVVQQHIRELGLEGKFSV